MSGTFALSKGSANQTIYRTMSEILHNSKNEWVSDRWQKNICSGSTQRSIFAMTPPSSAVSSRSWSKSSIRKMPCTHSGRDDSGGLRLVFDKARVMHFIANWKPWRVGIKEAQVNTTFELERAYSEWATLYNRVCNS